MLLKLRILNSNLPPILSSMVVISSLFLSSALAAEKASDAQIYSLMDKSGVTRTIENFPSQIATIGRQVGLTAKDQTHHKEHMKLMSSTVDTDIMLNKLYESLLKQTTRSEVNQLLSWINTPLAERVLAAEHNSFSHNFEQNLMRYLADLHSNPPTQERTQTILTFSQDTKMTDQALKVTVSLIENMFNSFKIAQPENTDLHRMLDSQLTQIGTMMRPAIEKQMILSAYYIYRDVSNEDLTQYGEFFKSKLGQRYLNILVNGLIVATNHWGKTLAEEVIKKETNTIQN